MSVVLYFIVRTDHCPLHDHMQVWSRERAADVTPTGPVEEGATHMCKAVTLTSLHSDFTKASRLQGGYWEWGNTGVVSDCVSMVHAVISRQAPSG